MKTLTYGQMPDWDSFRISFNSLCPSGVYEIRNDKEIGNEDFTLSQLYDFIEDACRDIDETDERMSLCSAILSTLNFEWV